MCGLLRDCYRPLGRGFRGVDEPPAELCRSAFDSKYLDHVKLGSNVIYI